MMQPFYSQIFLVSQIVCGSLLALILNLVLARSMPVAEYGSYTLAMSITAITAWGALCGYDVIASKRVREWSTDQVRSRVFVLSGVTVILIASLACAVTIWIIWHLFYQKSLSPNAVLAICLLTPTLAATRFFAAILTGLGQPRVGQAPERFLRDGVPLLIIGILYSLGVTTLDAALALILLCIGAIVALCVNQQVARKAGFVAIWDTSAARAQIIEHFPTSTRLALLAVGQILLTRLNLLVVGGVSGTEATGIYGAALALSEIGGFPAIAMSLYYAPLIAHTHRAGETPIKLMIAARRSSLFMMLPVVLSAVLFGGVGLELLFGDGFGAGHWALVLLLATHVVRAVALFPQLVLSLTGGERVALRLMAPAIILELILALLLVPMCGFMGAALGTAVSTVITQATLHRALSQRVQRG